jgi:signal transduction histidine kinase
MTYKTPLSFPASRRRSPSLRLRLLLSHVLVGALGLILITAVSHYKSFAFTQKVQGLEQGLDAAEDVGEGTVFPEQQILDRFHQVNNQGTLLFVGATAIMMGTVGCVLGQRIVCPLSKTEAVVRRAAAGELSVRVSPSQIPEIHRLGISINGLITSLQGVEERRQELMADLAHELRTPLTVIYGYVEMFEDGLAVTPESTQPMLKEMERIQRLIQDMLELSKIEAGHLPIFWNTFEPLPIVESVLKMLQDQAMQAHCQLQLVSAEVLPEIYADPDRFKQIVINLVSNAIAHAPAGQVTIGLWATDVECWVAVTDNGQGIAPENLPRVFERFWRGDRSRNGNFGSSGIGLAITKRLVELQGGHIEVESELGQGSTFRFSLPLAPSKAIKKTGFPNEAVGSSAR